MKLKKFATAALAAVMALGLLSACGNNNSPADTGSGDETGTVTLKVGASPAPHAEILEVVKPILAEEGIDVRVVSMPCMDVFEEQSEEYKEKVLPKSVRKRVAVEALGEFGWGKYVGLDGAVIAMEGFGASGPAGQLFEKFGFTVDHVVEAVKGLK